jgi:cell division septation protein DedD
MVFSSKKEIKVTASDALEFEPVVHHAPPSGRWLKVLVLLMLVGGGAGAWTLYGDKLQRFWGGAEGGIQLVKADPGPVKVRPENPGGLRVPDRDKLVYDRIQGKSGGPGQEGGPPEKGAERLLPPPEQPLPKPTAAKKPPPAAPESKPSTPEKLVAKPQPKPVAKVPTIKDVKTAERPAPPPPPPAPPTVIKSSTPVMDALRKASKKTAEKPAPEAKTVAPDPPAPPAVKKAPVKTAVPTPPPSSPQPAPETATAPETVKKPAPETAAVPEGVKELLKAAPIPKSKAYLVQLAAARSPQGARNEWTRLRTKNLDLLGDLGLIVTKADLGPAKGIYYRLRAGPLPDENQARRLCKQLAERRIGCLIIKPAK